MNKLIEKIHKCKNIADLDELRIEVVNFFNQCNDIEAMKKVHAEFRKAKNKVKRHKK